MCRGDGGFAGAIPLVTLVRRARLLDVLPPPRKGTSRARGPCKDHGWKVGIWTQPLAQVGEKLAQTNRVPPEELSHSEKAISQRSPQIHRTTLLSFLFVLVRKAHKSRARTAQSCGVVQPPPPLCQRYTGQTAHQQRGPRESLVFPKLLAPEGEHNISSTSLAICPCKRSACFSPFPHLLGLAAPGNTFSGVLQPDLVESYFFLPKS